MTEPGLLAAIAADPGDDTLRLVYADWLDETNQPERAEYLRLHAEIARLGREGRGHVRASGRLRELAADLPVEWRNTVGRRVDVWLVSWRPESAITVIKAVRGLTAMGLATAKHTVESAPAAVVRGVVREDAEVMAALLEAGRWEQPRALEVPVPPERPAYCRVELREPPTPG